MALGWKLHGLNKLKSQGPILFTIIGPWDCADLVKYYNSCKCCISGDTGIDNTKAHSKQ